MKVAICVPCRDTVMTGFAFDLAKLCAYEGVTRCAKGGSLMIYQVPGTMIFNQRERLAEQAIKDGADAILWIDSDMRFPKDALQILLSRKLPIVGVNATTRRFPVLPTALDYDQETKDLVKVTSKDKTGLEEVLGLLHRNPLPFLLVLALHLLVRPCLVLTGAFLMDLNLSYLKMEGRLLAYPLARSQCVARCRPSSMVP